MAQIHQQNPLLTSAFMEESELALRKREVFAVSLRKERKKAMLFEKRKKLRK